MLVDNRFSGCLRIPDFSREELRSARVARQFRPYYLFENACKALEKEPLDEGIWGAVNGLALLSTGKDEYLPRLKELAHKIGPKSLKVELHDGMFVWDWGYKSLSFVNTFC